MNKFFHLCGNSMSSFLDVTHLLSANFQIDADLASSFSLLLLFL